MVGVEQWAEIRRLHFVEGLSQREIRRRTGLHRDTIRRALSSERAAGLSPGAGGVEARSVQGRDPPAAASEDPKLPGVRVRELLEPLGCTASKTVVDDYLREVRPLFAPAPQDVSADGLSAGRDLPVRCLAAARGGPGRPRPDAPRLGRHRVLGLLARGRWRAGVLEARPRTCSPGSPAALSASAACRRRWSGTARPASTATAVGRREAFAGVLRPAAGRLAFLRAGRPAGQGRRRAAAGLRGDELRARPRASPTSSTSRTSSTPGLRRSTRARTRRCARGRSIASPTSWR